MDFLSRVDPELRQVLTLFPTLDLKSNLASARQFLSASPLSELPEHVRVSTRTIPGGGDQDMLLKIYESANRDQSQLPVLLWIHGGGYMIGHPDMDDSLCANFVEEVHCVVVSVDYRLAPEHPYPAAIEDCYSALVWIKEAQGDLNIDVTRLAIAGASAGGGLAAALALLARDRGGPAIAFQMPLYPMIDDRSITPSSHEITDKKAVWNRSNNLLGWSHYLGDYADGVISPYAAPARAKNLAGLPPTYTCVGQLEPFRDETIDYVARLVQAGVPVEFHLYPGCFHGFESMVPNAEISQRCRNGYIQALARALNPKQAHV